MNEYYPLEYRVTKDPGAQNLESSLKIRSKHQMSPDSWQSDAQTPEPRRASPDPGQCLQYFIQVSRPVKTLWFLSNLSFFLRPERSVCCVVYDFVIPLAYHPLL